MLIIGEKFYLDTSGLYHLWNKIKPKIDAKFGKVTVGADELTPTASDDSVEFIGSSPITVAADTSNNSVTIAHSTSGATAGTYGDSTAQTPTFGDTFKVPTVTVDAKGHITSASDHTVTIPIETSSIGSISVDGTTISSSSAGDTISLTSGNNVTLTPDAVNKTISIASASSVISGTTSYWETHGNVTSTKDVLYIYTDWKHDSDNEDIPGIKVGDGVSDISDLPFTDDIWVEQFFEYMQRLNNVLTAVQISQPYYIAGAGRIVFPSMNLSPYLYNITNIRTTDDGSTRVTEDDEYRIT